MIIFSKSIHALLSAILCLTTFGCATFDSQIGSQTVQSFPGCSASFFSSTDRAIISDDGLALALHCHDESVIIWEAAHSKASNLGKVTLFAAAVKIGIIPPELKCVDFFGLPSDEDCDVVDHTRDWSSFIVHSLGGTYGIIDKSSGKGKRLEVYTGGVILPRAGPANEVVLGELQDRKGLEVRSLLNWTVKPLLKTPIRNVFFQGTETEIDKISYSDAYDLLILSCGGTFSYFKGDVALIRAYNLEGVEIWTIRKALPIPTKEDGGFTGAYGNAMLFAGGRYAAIRSSESEERFDIVALGTGKTVGTYEGMPIATSANANRILIRTFTGDVKFIDVSQIVQERI